jgi:hypothetical protein
MIVSPDELRKDIVALITQINKQIDEVNKEANGMGIRPCELRDSSGGWVLAPLLQAKATAYNTLVMLQTTSARPAPRGHRQ